MKTMKKTLCVLLTALLIATVSVGAFAAEDRVLLSGEAGKNVTWTLTDDGVLTVSGTGAVEDEFNYEYDDDGEVSCYEKVNSISITLYAYYEAQTAGMDVEAAERARFDLVKEIVVEEGITAIPEEEFDSFYPRKVSLPASLLELGYSAVDATFASEVVIRSGALNYAQIPVAAYRTNTQPFADLDAAIEGYIEKCVREEAFQADAEPVYVVQDAFSMAHGLYTPTAEELAENFAYYSELLGVEIESMDQAAAVAIDLLNRRFGCDFTSPDDFCRIEEDEWGENVWYSDAWGDIYYAASNEVYEDGRLEKTWIGDTSEEDLKAYTWLTVVAPGESAIEEACKATGVSFKDLNEGLCKFCHKDHSANLWQKFVGFIHSILYFFKNLFTRK